jgi:WD40 repeat protein
MGEDRPGFATTKSLPSGAIDRRISKLCFITNTHTLSEATVRMFVVFMLNSFDFVLSCIPQLFLQVRCVASTHIGDLVSASRDCSVRVWPSSNGRVNQSDCMQFIGHEKFCISCCAIPPCARFPAGAVASCSQDSSIIIWDNGEAALTLLGHNEQVSRILLLLVCSH